jgi:hypothetical protein
MKNTNLANEHAPEQAIIQQILLMVQAMAALEAPSYDGKLLQAYNAVVEIFNQD